MTINRSLLREQIIKLLEEDTRFSEGDAITTSEGDKGIVTLSKHPFYAVKLDDTGTTHSYHFQNLIKDETTEPEGDFGKYDVEPKEEEQPKQEIQEIKVNKPLSFQKNIEDNYKPFEKGKNINITVYNLLKSNPGLTNNQIQNILYKSNKCSPSVAQIYHAGSNPLLKRHQIKNPTINKKIFVYYIGKPEQPLQESAPSEIIKLDGQISVYEDYNVGDVLSDVRSIPGITVVRVIDIPNETHKSKLAIKIDPYPFQGNDEASIKNRIKILIRKVPGCKEFWTNVNPLHEKKFRIKEIKVNNPNLLSLEEFQQKIHEKGNNEKIGYRLVNNLMKKYEYDPLNDDIRSFYNKLLDNNKILFIRDLNKL